MEAWIESLGDSGPPPLPCAHFLTVVEGHEDYTCHESLQSYKFFAHPCGRMCKFTDSTAEITVRETNSPFDSLKSHNYMLTH